MNDLFEELETVQSIAPQSVAYNAVTINGASYDRALKGANDILFIVDVGLFVAGGNYSFVIQDSSDNATFAVVTAANIRIPTGSAHIGSAHPVLIDDVAEDNKQYIIEYLGNKRYVRCSLSTSSGSAGAVTVAVIILGGDLTGNKPVRS